MQSHSSQVVAQRCFYTPGHDCVRTLVRTAEFLMLHISLNYTCILSLLQQNVVGTRLWRVCMACQILVCPPVPCWRAGVQRRAVLVDPDSGSLLHQTIILGSGCRSVLKLEFINYKRYQREITFFLWNRNITLHKRFHYTLGYRDGSCQFCYMACSHYHGFSTTFIYLNAVKRIENVDIGEGRLNRVIWATKYYIFDLMSRYFISQFNVDICFYTDKISACC